MTEEEVRRVFDAAQKTKCDHEAAEVDDHWNPFGGSCWCADPNQPVVIAGLLAVATEAARRERADVVARVAAVSMDDMRSAGMQADEYHEATQVMFVKAAKGGA